MILMLVCGFVVCVVAAAVVWRWADQAAERRQEDALHEAMQMGSMTEMAKAEAKIAEILRKEQPAR